MIRNLENDEKDIKLEFKSEIVGKKISFPEKGLKMEPYSSFLFPCDFKINDDTRIIYSTSEVVAKKKINNREYLILKGNENVVGEMVLDCKAKLNSIQGHINEEKYEKYSDKYKISRW